MVELSEKHVTVGKLCWLGDTCLLLGSLCGVQKPKLLLIARKPTPYSTLILEGCCKRYADMTSPGTVARIGIEA